MIYLNADDLKRTLNLDGLRETMRHALLDVASGRAVNPPRCVAEVPGGGLGFMAAFAGERRLLGYKAVAVFPGNAAMGLNPHQGLVVLQEAETGIVRAVVEGSELTALRTAAVTAAATVALCPRNASVLSVIGAGRQAYEHVRALRRVMSLRRVRLYNRSPAAALALARRLSHEFSLKVDVFTTARAAVAESDVVVSVTASRVPLFSLRDLKAGAHLNAIGACRPGAREVEFDCAARVFVDSRAACAAEASELDGGIQIAGEIGLVLAGSLRAREHSADITVFKSVGLGTEDIYAAEFFLNRARVLGLAS